MARDMSVRHPPAAPGENFRQHAVPRSGVGRNVENIRRPKFAVLRLKHNEKSGTVVTRDCERSVYLPMLLFITVAVWR